MSVKSFRLADESLNAYGFWLMMDGGDLEQFRRNPIMLWMHMRAWKGTRDEILPIGHWENIRIEDGALLADPVFDTDDDFAATIARKVEKGIIRMASVGITIIETSMDPAYLKPGQTHETVTKWKLREASIVDIGANDNAMSLAFYDQDGNPLEHNAESGKCPVKPIELQPQKTYEMKELANMLSLSDQATEKDIAEKVKELQIKLQQQQAELEQYKLCDQKLREQKVKELIDEAIRDGRINADARQAWEKMFSSNHEDAEKALAGLPKRQSVKSAMQRPNLKDELSALSWDELDKKGKLKQLRANYPELYEQKFLEKFGKKPA